MLELAGSTATDRWSPPWPPGLGVNQRCQVPPVPLPLPALAAPVIGSNSVNWFVGAGPPAIAGGAGWAIQSPLAAVLPVTPAMRTRGRRRPTVKESFTAML